MENVGVWQRAVAIVIDFGTIFCTLGYGVAWITGNITEGGFELTGAPACLFFSLWFAYFVIMEVTFGATLGKLFLGLRVVKYDGSAVDWRTALIRNALRIVDGQLFYLLGAIFVWNSPQRQRLGDRVAETIVIRKR